MGQGSVYQVLGFVVVISENYIPIVTLIRCLWELVSSIWFLVLLFFYSVPGSPQMFVWWDPLLFVTYYTYYAFTGLSCCILCFLVKDYFPVTWCNGTTMVKWWALQHVVIALFCLLVCGPVGLCGKWWKLSTISLIFIVGLSLVDAMGLPGGFILFFLDIW